MVYCPNCGKEIVPGSKYCADCGAVVDGFVQTGLHNQAPNRTVAVSIKNPGVAAVLSFLLCGLGQIYDGKILRGLLFIIFEIVLIFSWIPLMRLMPMPIFLSFVGAVIFWVWNVFDAYKVANTYNGFVETTGNKPW